MTVLANTEEDACLAAGLVTQTRRFGRGLGDRSRMALAMCLGVPALTTDGEWRRIEAPGLEVRLVR